MINLIWWGLAWLISTEIIFVFFLLFNYEAKDHWFKFSSTLYKFALGSFNINGNCFIIWFK